MIAPFVFSNFKTEFQGSLSVIISELNGALTVETLAL